MKGGVWREKAEEEETIQSYKQLEVWQMLSGLRKALQQKTVERILLCPPRFTLHPLPGITN